MRAPAALTPSEDEPSAAIQAGPLDARRMGSAVIWRGAYLLAQGGLSVGLFAALAHTLSTTAFAITAAAQGILVIAWSVGDLGLAQAAVTVLPERLARSDNAPAVLGGAATAFALASAVATVFCGGAVLFAPAGAKVSLLLVAPAAAVTVLVSGADGLLRAQGEFRRPVQFILESRVGAFAAVAAAVVTKEASWTCAAMSVGMAIGSVRPARYMWTTARHGDAASAWHFTRDSLPLGMSQLLTVGGGRLNTLILVSVSNIEAAAVFETAWRVYQLGQYVVGAVATGWAPFFADALGGDRRQELIRLLKRSILLVVGAGLLTGAVLLVAGERVGRALAGATGNHLGRVLLPLAISTPLTFLGFFLTFVVSASPRYRRYLIPAYGAGAVVNVALTLLLGQAHGASGAALASATGLSLSSICLAVVTARLIRSLRESSE